MAAATNLRSASNAGSTSSTSTKNSTDGIKKKFCCTHPGCGKSFSRSEHLHRHALNHKDGNNTCLRCSAHFRRRDLLDRHMARHKEKDDEAGGEGLGILATRKRLWRDAEGNIVNARRPSYTQESGNKRRMINKSASERKNSHQQMMEHERRMSSAVMTTLPPSPASMTRVNSAHSTIIVDTSRPSSTAGSIYLLPNGELQQQKFEHEDLSRAPWFHNTGSATLLSPTASASSYSDPESSLQSESQSPAAELDTLYEDAWPVSSHHSSTAGLPQIVSGSPNTHPHHLLGGRESDYPASPGWGPQPSFQTFMGAIGEFEEPSLKDAYGAAMGGMYGWQNPWSVGGGGAGQQQTTLSRCREEKFETLNERGGYPHQEVLRRGFGLGGC